jgi:hypothetical protein
MNENNNIISMDTPENPLQELLKKGAQQLLAQAIEAANEWSEMAINLNEIFKLGLVISKLKYQK